MMASEVVDVGHNYARWAGLQQRQPTFHLSDSLLSLLRPRPGRPSLGSICGGWSRSQRIYFLPRMVEVRLHSSRESICYANGLGTKWSEPRLDNSTDPTIWNLCNSYHICAWAGCELQPIGAVVPGACRLGGVFPVPVFMFRLLAGSRRWLCLWLLSIHPRASARTSKSSNGFCTSHNGRGNATKVNSPWCKWSPLRSRLWWSSVM
jgi:hypothetical protein